MKQYGTTAFGDIHSNGVVNNKIIVFKVTVDNNTHWIKYCYDYRNIFNDFLYDKYFSVVNFDRNKMSCRLIVCDELL